MDDERDSEISTEELRRLRSALADVFRHVETLHGDPWPTIGRLTASGHASLVPPVQAALERYLDEHQWYGRDLMVRILADLRGTAAFPLLLRAFARPLDFDDRDNLCSTLAEVMDADPEGCRPTILSFIATGHRDLRRAGIWALGYVIQPDDLEMLRDALTDADPEVRQDALGALSGLENDRRAYDLIVAALQDPDGGTRRSAVLGLCPFTDPATLDHLLALEQDPDIRVRAVLGEMIATLAAGSDRRPAATQALLRLLADPAPQVREGAARGLGQLGSALIHAYAQRLPWRWRATPDLVWPDH